MSLLDPPDSKHKAYIGKVLEAFALWDAFVTEVRYRHRYLPQDVVVQAILRESSIRSTIESGEVFYRARVHSPEEHKGPYRPEDMGPPKPAEATAGRLNPEGIAYLYVASDPDTAVAEVRPWRQALVTVASVRIEAPTPVLDLTKKPPLGSDDEHLIDYVSFMIRAPAHEKDRLAYVAWQYLAERVKRADLQGIRYGSALNPGGENLVLFDHSNAKTFRSELRQVTEVTITSAVKQRPANLGLNEEPSVLWAEGEGPRTFFDLHIRQPPEAE